MKCDTVEYISMVTRGKYLISSSHHFMFVGSCCYINVYMNIILIRFVYCDTLKSKVDGWFREMGCRPQDGC